MGAAALGVGAAAPGSAARPRAGAPTQAPLPASDIPVHVVTADEPPADDAADAFISYESQRIHAVLEASNANSDESKKTKVLEACMQRIQLLSNLRSLIEGSGARSRLAAAARNAKTESERLAFVTRLFGSDVAAHWAPKDANDDVVVETREVEADAERILRDSSGKFTDAQKKHALYALLARTSPTEEQQLWLATIVEGFLQ